MTTSSVRVGDPDPTADPLSVADARADLALARADARTARAYLAGLRAGLWTDPDSTAAEGLLAHAKESAATLDAFCDAAEAALDAANAADLGRQATA